MSDQFPLLLLSDFDGTAAKTFVKSPKGIGVHEAYHLALERLFGKAVLEVYHSQGGLKNQAPGELIATLTGCEPGLLCHAACLHPDVLSETPTDAQLTKMFVDIKLDILVGEISPEWPVPCTGFLELHKELVRLREAGFAIDLGFITNGHDRFLRRTFNVWGIDCPEVMVTEEDVRDLSWPRLLKDRFKPQIFPFTLAMNKWAHLNESAHASRVIYFGDDWDRDGGLATNAAVPFGYFHEGEDADLSERPPGSFQFSDWAVVARSLTSLAPELLRGLPCDEIFAHLT